MNDSDFFDRMNIIMKYHGIKNLNTLATKHLGYKSAEKLNRVRREESLPSIDIIVDIAKKFNEFSLDWLILGEGKIFKSQKVYSNDETDLDISKENNITYEKSTDEYIIQELLIKNIQIKAKDEQLKNKDEEINRLLDIVDEKLEKILKK